MEATKKEEQSKTSKKETSKTTNKTPKKVQKGEAAEAGPKGGCRKGSTTHVLEASACLNSKKNGVLEELGENQGGHCKKSVQVVMLYATVNTPIPPAKTGKKKKKNKKKGKHEATEKEEEKLLGETEQGVGFATVWTPSCEVNKKTKKLFLPPWKTKSGKCNEGAPEEWKELFSMGPQFEGDCGKGTGSGLAAFMQNDMGF